MQEIVEQLKVMNSHLGLLNERLESIEVTLDNHAGWQEVLEKDLDHIASNLAP